MNAQRAAEVQAVLEGIALPATRDELIAYAREYDAGMVDDLQGLPDQEYRRIDDVGRFLTLPAPAPERAPGVPRAESGLPPGGDDYLQPHPADTGEVRDDAPPENPPQKAIEKASRTQKRQAEQRA